MQEKSKPIVVLNPQSPIPLYRQLADILTERVRNGDYPPGSPIPSENTLAVSFGMSLILFGWVSRQ